MTFYVIVWTSGNPGVASNSLTHLYLGEKVGGNSGIPTCPKQEAKTSSSSVSPKCSCLSEIPISCDFHFSGLHCTACALEGVTVVRYQ